LKAESRAVAMRVFRLPLEGFSDEPWTQQQCADLRRYLVQIIERHVEKKLVTAVMLNKL
jgi:DNA repair protein RecO (recombination protein O)